MSTILYAYLNSWTLPHRRGYLMLGARGVPSSIYSIIYVNVHSPCWSSLTKGVLWQERNGSHMETLENRLLLNNPNVPTLHETLVKTKTSFSSFYKFMKFRRYSIYWKHFVFAKMFAKIINNFAKTANVFKVPRVFAPVLHISRKLSWKNIFSRNFSWNIMSSKYFSQELSHFHMLLTSYAFLEKKNKTNTNICKFSLRFLTFSFICSGSFNDDALLILIKCENAKPKVFVSTLAVPIHYGPSGHFVMNILFLVLQNTYKYLMAYYSLLHLSSRDLTNICPDFLTLAFPVRDMTVQYDPSPVCRWGVTSDLLNTLF